MRAKLPARRRWAVYSVAAGLWGSGALWLPAHFWWLRQGDYGPEASPVEPATLAIHGGFAMGALWIVGLLYGVHVVAGWRARRGRWTGSLLLGMLLILAVSGYLLYYLGDEGWRGHVSIAHWSLGLATMPGFLWHRFARKSWPRA